MAAERYGVAVVGPAGGEDWRADLVMEAAQRAGFAVARHDAIAAIDEGAAIVVLPLPFAGLEGTECVERVRAAHGDAAVVVVARPGAEALALEALRRGADHAHPLAGLDVDELADVLRRVALRSDRARAAAASDRRYRAMVEDSPDIVTLISADGRVLYANPRTRAILGYDPILGEVNRQEIHPDDFARSAAFFYDLLATPRGSRRVEFRCRHADGTYRWLECVATNHVDDPHVGGLIANYRDITERKEHEAALREARRRLEFLMSATSAVTYTCRASGDCGTTFMSSNVTALTGYEAHEFIADPIFWIERVHPEDRERVEGEVARVVERGAHSFEYRFRRADGAYVWVHDEMVVERDADGAPKEFVGYWVDITTRKAAADALQRSESRFRALIEHAPIGVLVHREGVIVYANPALVALLGHERVEDLVGLSSLEIVHPDDRAVIRARQQSTYGGAHAPPLEQRLLRRDGGDVVVEAEGMHMEFDGAGAAVVLVRDLSERRELLARLAVADRMLSVGTLAAGVAHEINNPLTYVLMNALLLVEDLPRLLGPGRSPRLRSLEEAAAVAHEVHQGALRMRAIVRDLLSLARADDLTVGPVDVRQVLEVAVKMAWNEIRHRARLVNHVDPDLPLTLANESRLVQVFLNLLLNAAQAIPDGHADEHEIRLSAAREGDVVAVTVEDTGVGIPRDAIGRIFDPFFTTKPIGVGTGLGLSICHRIVRDVGGEIAVESTPGRGTRFRVTLPIAVSGAAALPPRGGDRRPNARRLSILVIDDEAVIGRTMARLLAPEADVDLETHARAALARIEAGGRYDVLFCDMMMPEMNGMDFHAALERVAPDLAGRLVFLTGGAFTASARAFLDRVPNPRLAKPFELSEIQAALRALG